MKRLARVAVMPQLAWYLCVNFIRFGGELNVVDDGV